MSLGAGYVPALQGGVDCVLRGWSRPEARVFRPTTHKQFLQHTVELERSKAFLERPDGG